MNKKAWLITKLYVFQSFVSTSDSQIMLVTTAMKNDAKNGGYGQCREMRAKTTERSEGKAHLTSTDVWFLHRFSILGPKGIFKGPRPLDTPGTRKSGLA